MSKNVPSTSSTRPKRTAKPRVAVSRQPKRILVAVNLGIMFDHELMNPLFRSHGDIVTLDFLWARPLAEVQPHLKHVRLDGVIGRIMTPGDVAIFREAGIPAVSWIEPDNPLNVPVVITDDAAVGRLAAEHLLSEGHRQFAFVGNERTWSLKREAAFVQTVAGQGFGVTPFRWTREESDFQGRVTQERQAAYRSFIKQLPKPTGVMCANDIEAAQFLVACRAEGCHVPNDLAVIGVDTDRWCKMTGAHVSSVAQNYPRIAQTALQVLETLIKGEPPPPSPILIPPLGVIVRSSSSVTVTPDAQVNKALAYIKEHACEPVDVEAAAKHAGLSLRMLEYRFQDLLKRSPFDEFMRLRIRRAQQMLMETDQKVEDIARECGFNNTQGFYPVFRRLSGVPPGIFRIQKRGL